MKRTAVVLSGLLLGLLLGVPGVEAGPRPPEVNVLESNGQRIVLELTVPGFRVTSRNREGTTYHSIVVPDLKRTWEVGKPQVPSKGVLLGVPSTGKVSVSVLESVCDTRAGLLLYPGPRAIVERTEGGRALKHEFFVDPAAYEQRGFYPGRFAEIGFSGYLRDQRVVQLRLYPFRYNPVTRELRCCSKLRVQLSIASGTRKLGSWSAADHGAFEQLLAGVLLNYEGLGRKGRGPGGRARASAHERLSDEGAADQSALKIGVEEDGLYRLDYAQLQDAGLDLAGIDPRTIKITRRNREIPIYVHGEEDGAFDAEDYVEFYGQAMTGPFTARNVYWLTTGGAEGLRRAERDASLDGVHPTPSSFPATLHAEEDRVYWQNPPNGAEPDHWFWRGPLEAPANITITFGLHHIATEQDKSAALRVALRGRTDDYGADPDHHTSVALNGVQVSDGLWDGQIEHQHAVTVPQSVLTEGVNTLTVRSLGHTGAGVDAIYLDWFEMEYWDTFVAEDDSLEFRRVDSGTWQFGVTSFSEEDVSIFDISDPADVGRLIHPVIEPADGTYTVRFQDAVEDEARYLVLTSARRRSPAALALDRPSDLRSPTNAADYVIITPDAFYESIQPLASHRRSKGLRVTTVRVADIYDEFNHGIFNPRAIRDFLRYAYHHWTDPPLYVLLVGDANMGNSAKVTPFSSLAE